MLILFWTCTDKPNRNKQASLNCEIKTKIIVNNLLVNSNYKDSLSESVIPELTCLFDSVQLWVSHYDSLFYITGDEQYRDTSYKSAIGMLNHCYKTFSFSDIGGSTHTRFVCPPYDFNGDLIGYFELYELYFKNTSSQKEAKTLIDNGAWNLPALKVKKPSIAVPNWSYRCIPYKNRLIIVHYGLDNIENSKKVVGRIEQYLTLR